MKKNLLLLFLFSTIVSYSQSNTVAQLTTVNFNTYGYIDGKRLDSINAEYGQFGWHDNSIIFNYGQLSDNWKRMRITDSNGVPLMFANTNKMFVLNFFYFNGWQLDHVFTNDLVDKYSNFILKKRMSQ